MQTKGRPVRTNTVLLEIIIDLPFGFPINNIISQVQPLDLALLTTLVWNLLFKRIHAPIYHQCSLLLRMGPLFVSIAFQLSWFLVTRASVTSFVSVIWCHGHSVTQWHNPFSSHLLKSNCLLQWGWREMNLHYRGKVFWYEFQWNRIWTLFMKTCWWKKHRNWEQKTDLPAVQVTGVSQSDWS